MKRTLNFTGRKKIERKRIKIRLFEDKTFIASLDFEGLELPNDAKIYIEPYFKNTHLRFDFGTVDEMVVPKNTSLREIPYSDTILFRIKVVDETGNHGLLLAMADGVPPQLPESVLKKNFGNLPVTFVDLGQQVWRVVFPPDDDYAEPHLEINDKIKFKQVLESPQFLSLVYPDVARQIAKEIAFGGEEFNESEDVWQTRWLKTFIHHFGVEPFPGEEDEGRRKEWVNDVSLKFSKTFRTMDKFSQFMDGVV